MQLGDFFHPLPVVVGELERGAIVGDCRIELEQPFPKRAARGREVGPVGTDRRGGGVGGNRRREVLEFRLQPGQKHWPAVVARRTGSGLFVVVDQLRGPSVLPRVASRLPQQPFVIRITVDDLDVLVDGAGMIVQARERRDQSATQPGHAARALVGRQRRRPHRLDRRSIEVAQLRIVLRDGKAVGHGREILGIEWIVGKQPAQQVASAPVVVHPDGFAGGLEGQLPLQRRIRIGGGARQHVHGFAAQVVPPVIVDSLAHDAKNSTVVGVHRLERPPGDIELAARLMEAHQRTAQLQLLDRVGHRVDLARQRSRADRIKPEAGGVGVDGGHQLERRRAIEQLDQKLFEIGAAVLRLEHGNPQRHGPGRRLVPLDRRRCGPIHDGPVCGAFRQDQQPAPCRLALGRRQRALHVLVNGSCRLAQPLMDRASFVGVQRWRSQFAPPFLNHPQRIVEAEVIPEDRGRFKIGAAAPGLEAGQAVPECARAVVLLAIGVDLAERRQRCRISRIEARQPLLRGNGGVDFARIGVGQRAMQRAGAMTGDAVGRVFRGERGEERSRPLEPRLPDIRFRQKAGGHWILFRQTRPVSIRGGGIAGADGFDFSRKPVRPGQRGEELRGQIGVFEPVTPQQRVVRGQVERFARGVRGQQVANEQEMMREPVVRVAIQLQEQLRVDARARRDHGGKVPRELRAGEGAGHVFRQGPKRRGLPPAQKPPGEAVMPRTIRELLHGAPVGVFDLHGEIVLIEELSRGRIEAGIVWIAVDFTPVHLKGIGQPFLRHQAGDIAIEHTRIFLRANASRRALGAVDGPFRGHCPRPQRHAAGARRQLLQQPIVDGELLVHLLGACERIGHLESHAGPLRSAGKRRHERAPAIDHGIGLTVGGIGRDQRRVQFGPARRCRKARFKKREQIGGAGAVKVRHGRPFFLGELIARGCRVEQQRKDAVQKPGVRIKPADVPIERQIAEAEPERLLRLGQQGGDDAGECAFGIGRARAGQAVDGGVVAKRFVDVARLLVEPGQREQLAGAAAGVAAARFEIGERPFGGGSVAVPVVVIEDADNRREIAGPRRDVGAGAVEKRAERMRPRQKLEVVANDAVVPQRTERAIVHGHRIADRSAMDRQLRARFQQSCLIVGKRSRIVREQRFSVCRAIESKQEAEQPVVRFGLSWMARNPGAILRFSKRVGQLLRPNQGKQTLEGAPRSPLVDRQRRVGLGVGRLCGRRKGIGLLLRLQATMVEVGERELSCGAVRRGIRVRLPVGLRRRRIEHLFRGAGPQREPFAIGRIGRRRRRERPVRFGRRAPHLDRSAGHRHGAKQRVVKAASGFDVAQPAGNLGAACQRRGGGDGKHEQAPRQPVMRPTAPHRMESPGSRRCARCLRP